jgi:hypothetical protein
MTGGRRLLYAVIGVLGFGLAAALLWRVMPDAAVGDIDPFSAVVGVAGLVVGVGSSYLAIRAQRWQETNVAELTVRLADAVRQAEQEQRSRLLGEHDRTIDVVFDVRPSPAHGEPPPRTTGTLSDVVAFYTELRSRRLVVTGAPGAGKTVLAVDLVLGLLEERAPDDPVPMRIPAASWDTTRPVQEWLARHLVDTYRQTPAAAAAVVRAHKVLPVIDGLDELDSDAEPGYGSPTARAVTALNGYLHGRRKAAVVLTCRNGQYEALEGVQVWLQDAVQVQIRPVDAAEARRFVLDRAIDPQRWQPVLDAIDSDPDGPLALGLSTPWRLTLAAIIYEQRDPGTGAFRRQPAELIEADLDTANAVRDHLLGLFIPTVTQLHGGRYRADRVERWLTVLARYLERNTAAASMIVRYLDTEPDRGAALPALPRLVAGAASWPADAGDPGVALLNEFPDERSARRWLADYLGAASARNGPAVPGLNLVLHQLWPIAGFRRPRTVTLALSAVPLAAALSVAYLIGARIAYIVLFAAYVAYKSFEVTWPRPERRDPRRLFTSAGRSTAIFGATLFGVGMGLTGLLIGGPVGLAIGGVLGLGMGVSIATEQRDTIGVTDPRDLLRGTVGSAVGSGLSLGVISWLLWSGLPGNGVGAGVAYGTTAAVWVGAAAFRYLALLLCTRRWSRHPLPWRLGRFLGWCYGAGLIRVAGIGYEFRHRELQDYLARRPAAVRIK